MSEPRRTKVTCLRWNCSPDKPCQRCRAIAATADAPMHVAWFTRTGHCGLCGQPGNFCLCTDAVPCGCRDLHPIGSGIEADPTDVFAAPRASDGQGELFA